MTVPEKKSNLESDLGGNMAVADLQEPQMDGLWHPPPRSVHRPDVAAFAQALHHPLLLGYAP
jgi:hypothetical protein